MKIVYVVGGLLAPNGMSSVLSAKINYLAEHTDYELYMILTEKAGQEWYYQINPKVRWVNFDINFDELDTLPLPKKLFCFWQKQRKYRKLFTDYLMKVRPDITVSTVRREINFINDIPDGSKKIGEIHFNRTNYREFKKKWLPDFLNHYISRLWMGSLLKQLKRLDRFVVLSEEDYKNWPELDNKQVIPNSISYFPDFYSSCDSKQVIAVGRYTWQKGFDLLLQAWKLVYEKHPDWHLNIYGSGERRAYEHLISEFGISDVVSCHPAVSDIYEKYRESSVFVLSSRYEGFGLVLVEAMSTGVPAVSFACPCGPSDIITDGEDGILVENGDVDKLADAICWMIDHPEERKQYGECARRNAKRFAQDKVMDMWLELFQTLTL
ncbi:MAG: glycosyltransferase family 4 protein [Prevotella sp.]|nr:glycosyltransferase family 4 protein [Prevotella sp.]